MSDGAPDASGAPSGFARLLTAVVTELPEHRDELNRLDGAAGDGDLGLTVAAGCRALIEITPTLETLAEAAAIRAAGLEIAKKAPSTGGTLIAFALMAAAKAPIEPSRPAVERAAAYLEAAAAAIAQRGQVGPGDRTMLDALLPARAAVRVAADAGHSGADAARSAAAAADAGARATASMAARVGRAGWLADRAAGHEDAGARLVALAFHAAASAAGAREA